MRFSKLISGSGAIALAIIIAFGLAGCDSVDVSDGQDGFVRPTVTVHFVNGAGRSASKADAILDVTLVVTTLSGTDYSPEPVRVDDSIEDEVRFDLVVPPDSAYQFRVRFEESGQLIGEGGLIQTITELTTQVDIPVLTARDEPWLGIIPSDVDMGVRSGTVDLILRYYGGSTGIAGLAAEITQTGSDPADIEFLNIDVVETSGASTALAWRFNAPYPTGVIDMGLIRVPVSSPAEFCLEMNPGDAKSVNSEGTIIPVGASGSCVNVVNVTE